MIISNFIIVLCFVVIASISTHIFFDFIFITAPPNSYLLKIYPLTRI